MSGNGKIEFTLKFTCFQYTCTFFGDMFVSFSNEKAYQKRWFTQNKQTNKQTKTKNKQTKNKTKQT